MFEAADPEVFAWYIKNWGPEVNLFVDQPGRPAGMPALGHLGNRKPLGACGDLQGMRNNEGQ